MHIMGLPGSLRDGSFNTRLLRAAAHVMPDEANLAIFDGVGRLPLFDEDLEGGHPHPAVAELNAAIAGADAVLVATPEYNGSIPGPLKNALDWASRPHGAAPLAGMPVAVVGASPSRFGAVRAQADVRKVAASIGAQVVDQGLPVAAAFQAFDANDRLVNPDHERQLADVLESLVRSAPAALAAP